MKLVAILLSALAFFLLSSSAWSETSRTTPIKIGATLALSGKLAFIGKEERDGLLLAVEEVNEAGGVNGRTLELILEDNNGDTKAAVSGVTKLLAVDSVDVIFSAFTHVTQAIRDIIARREKTLIYASSLGSIAKSNRRFFRDYFDAGQSGRAIGTAVVAAAAKKVAYLGETNDACEEYERHFVEAVKIGQVEIVRRASYLPGESDFKALLLKVKHSKPDAIVFCTWRDTHIVMRQLDQLGMIGIPHVSFCGTIFTGS